jgi:hypothetical protein
LDRAFSNPASFTFGNSGRDLLRGPGVWDFDVSINKKFIIPIGSEGRYHVNFRADFYNAFNHPNFAQPNATVGSAAARCESPKRKPSLAPTLKLHPPMGR